MAITSFGYDGTITESQFAQGVRHIGSARYGVSGPGDWRVTVAGGTRTVSIAAGSGWGPGVFDVSDAPETLSMDAAPSGQQWNLVVARRDWDTNTTSFDVVTGGSAMTIPGGRESEDGVLDDQPLAFVRVDTSTSIQEIVDARVWPGTGGMVAVNEAVLQYMDEPGTAVLIAGNRWTRSVTSGYGAEWVRESVWDTGWVTMAMSTGWSPVAGHSPRIRRIGDRVQIEGAALRGAGGSLASIVQVPAGFRTGKTTFYGTTVATRASARAMGELYVTGSGVVSVDSYHTFTGEAGWAVPLSGTYLLG